MTPLLALHCHPNDPVAGTVLLPNQTMTVLRLQSNRPNDRADTPAIQQPINRSSSECSTYYYYLMLAPHCHQNWHLAALPAATYLGTTILHFHNLLAAYPDTTILWFYFILNWFYFILIVQMGFGGFPKLAYLMWLRQLYYKTLFRHLL